MASLSTTRSKVDLETYHQSTQSLEKSLSISDFYELNKTLRLKTKETQQQYQQQYPGGVLSYADDDKKAKKSPEKNKRSHMMGKKKKTDTNTSPHVKAPTLLSYTQMPAARTSFDDFGKQKVYKSGWDYQSRSTALGIPADAMEYSEFESSEKGGLKRSGSKPILPPISPSRSFTSTTSIMTGWADSSGAEKFSYWVYQNKNMALTALSGYDITEKGYMSPQRMVQVFETLDIGVDTEVLEEVVSEASTESVRSGKKAFHGVVDYADWLHMTWLEGLAIYNKYATSSPLKAVQLDPLPAYLVRDGGSTKEEVVKQKLVADLVMAKRKQAKDKMEYAAANTILQQCNFEKLKSESREKIDRTISAYSSGNGTKRALKEASARIANNQ